MVVSLSSSSAPPPPSSADALELGGAGGAGGVGVNNTRAGGPSKNDGTTKTSSSATSTSADAGESTVAGASINFTNCIVGAGCIGYGSAIASTGGLLSMATMLAFAVLNKLSFDLIIELTIETGGALSASYEDLGYTACGRPGSLSVLYSKMIFAFGALVAIAVIVKDNFSTACRSILGISDEDEDEGEDVADAEEVWWTEILLNKKLSALILCATVMLPICLLRDMTPLERFSAIKIAAFMMIICIVIYLYAAYDASSQASELGISNDFYVHWLEIRPGFIENMGTYIFTFIAQHTCHLVYRSLKPEIRNLHHWKQVSTAAVALSTVLSLPIGLFAYMMYWEKTSSDLFLLYPSIPIVNVARVLLCIVALLSYPMPFFSCRELIIVALPKKSKNKKTPSTSLPKSALDDAPAAPNERDHLLNNDDLKKSAADDGASQASAPWLMPGGDDRQLIRKYHVLLTVSLWGISVYLALQAPSLGDVLNLMGCATGTIIAFILPAVFSYRIRGYSTIAAVLFVIGGVVGSIGTYNSIVQIVRDVHSNNNNVDKQ